jgi:hypothetical protein
MLILLFLPILFYLCQTPVNKDLLTKEKELKRENLTNLRSQSDYSASNGILLIDKIYTIHTPKDNLTFENICLQKDYNYIIFLETVTPHECSVKIKVFDPEEKEFYVLEEFLSDQLAISFGTAFDGNHTFKIIAQSHETLNIHIKLQRGSKCLYDHMENRHKESLIFYEVNCFGNATKFTNNFDMKSDMMHKFYIRRVSSIAKSESRDVKIKVQLYDPEDIVFNIYEMGSSIDLKGTETFNFGTSRSGTYIFTITIFCEVPYINLAYCVSEDYQVSNVIDANNTDCVDDGDLNATNSESEQEENSNNNPNTPLEGELSTEWILGLLFFLGVGLTGTIFALLHFRKNKS